MIEFIVLFYTIVILFWGAIIFGAIAIGLLLWAAFSAVYTRLNPPPSYSDPTPPASGS